MFVNPNGACSVVGIATLQCRYSDDIPATMARHNVALNLKSQAPNASCIDNALHYPILADHSTLLEDKEKGWMTLHCGQTKPFTRQLS